MKAIELVWPGGEHTFDLRIGELQALQDACDAGPEFILNRIMAGQWRYADLFDTIRLGLIGGGMERTEANKLTRDAFDRSGLVAFKITASSILGQALYGVADDPVGKADPVTPTPEGEKTAAGNSAPSTD